MFRSALLTIAGLFLSCGIASADYIAGRDAASSLAQKGKREEALEAFVALASTDVTDFQKSDALEQAAGLALRLKQYDRALRLAEEISIPAVAKTVQMQTLLRMQKPEEIVARFAGENLDAWPFWKAGEAFYTRGVAFSRTGAGKAAEADFAKAFPLTTEDVARAQVLLEMGRNRDENLHDEVAALEAYRRIIAECRAKGNAVYFRALLCTATILTKQNRLDEAEATLHKVEIHGLRGYWHGAMLLGLADVLTKRGRRKQARAAYREILEDSTTQPNHREAAKQALGSFQD